MHAPWPFKTINGPNGALSYIPPLPSSGSVEWTYAVIHLLPGLYARTGTYGFDPNNPSIQQPNPDNGLYPNGEIFPINLPKRVSLQGTSALNTLFDVAFDPNSSVGGPAIQFGVGNATGEGSFVDSIAFFGAAAESSEPNGPIPPKGNAAILIEDQVASKPTFSNCFFMGNGIGVLINASYSQGGPFIQHDGTAFFNNTFAFNVVGLWNGQLSAPANSVKGVSKLILVNNIFDSSPDSGGTLSYPKHFWHRKANSVPSNSGFEGVDASDLQIQVGSNLVKSNAYEFKKGTILVKRVNTGATWATIVGLSKATATRSGLSTPAPAIDIAPYTLSNGANQRRGVLFVRDLLAQPQFSQPDFDGSPHDFRLAPAVGLVWDNNTPLALTKLNPLAEAGWGGPFPMTMQNGLGMAHEPGFLPLNSASQNTWAFHNWNWDCEGYGNPRFQSAGYFYPPKQVDIGADDLAQLVIAGYRFGTTSFIKVSKSTSPLINKMENQRFWYLGPPTGMTYATNKTVPAPFPLKPRYRTVDHLTGNPPQNYVASGSSTVYPPWWSPWSFQKSTNYYFPEVTEIVPHLLDDPHPWWTSSQTLGFSRATNPIWQSCIAQYNLGLYADPTFGRVNPPGSYKGDPSLAYQWLDLTWTITNNSPLSLIQFFDYAIPFRTPQSFRIDKFDAWSRGFDDSKAVKPVVSVFPPTTPSNSNQPLALRFAVAHQLAPFSNPLDYTQSNLQSFLVYIEGGGQ